MGLFFNPSDPKKSFGSLGKYVDDYKIVETTDEKRSRPRRQVFYTGAWFQLREPVTARIRVWSSLGMAVILAALYIRMLLLTHAVSGQLAVMLPLLAGLFPILYLLMGAFSLPFRGKPMRRDQYMQSFIRASRSATAIAVFAAAGLIVSLIYRMIRKDWLFLSEDWLFLVLCVLSILLALGIIFLLRSVDIAERENAAFGEARVL